MKRRPAPRTDGPAAAALALVAVLAGAAAANPAVSPRLLALGDDATYLEDARGVLRWYGSLTDHPAAAVLAAGLRRQDGDLRRDGRRASGPVLGAQLRPGSAALGLWLADRGDDTDPGAPLPAAYGPTATLLAGHVLGDAALGAAWRHGTTDPGTPAAAAAGPVATDAVHDALGVGARLELGPDAYVDVAGEWRDDRVETDAGTRRSGGAWGLRARAFWGLSDALVLTPAAELRRAGGPLVQDAVPVDVAGHAWRLGCGLTWLPDPDRLVLVVAEHRGADLDRTWAARGGPLAVGTRSAVWALRAAAELRGGAFWSVRLSAGIEQAGRDDTHGGAASGAWSQDRTLVPVAVGLGAHLGRWDLDLGLASQAPADGTGLRPAADGDATWLAATLAAAF